MGMEISSDFNVYLIFGHHGCMRLVKWRRLGFTPGAGVLCLRWFRIAQVKNYALAVVNLIFRACNILAILDHVGFLLLKRTRFRLLLSNPVFTANFSGPPQAWDTSLRAVIKFSGDSGFSIAAFK